MSKNNMYNLNEKLALLHYANQLPTEKTAGAQLSFEDKLFLVKTALPSWQGFGQMARNIAGPIVDTGKGLGQGFKSGADRIDQAAKGGAGIFGQIGAGLKGVGDMAAGTVGGAWQGTKNVFKGVGQGLDGLRQGYNSLVGAPSAASDKLTEKVKSGDNPAPDVTPAGRSVQDTFKKLVPAGTGGGAGGNGSVRK